MRIFKKDLCNNCNSFVAQILICKWIKRYFSYFLNHCLQKIWIRLTSCGSRTTFISRTFSPAVLLLCFEKASESLCPADILHPVLSGVYRTEIFPIHSKYCHSACLRFSSSDNSLRSFSGSQSESSNAAGSHL